MFTGVVYAYLFKPSYEISEAIRFVPTGVCGCVPDGYTLRRLAAMTQSQHPGVQITVARNLPSVYISATGSIPGADRAVRSAARDLIAPSTSAGPSTSRGCPPRLPWAMRSLWLDRLLAGLGAALGFLVPPRARSHI
jgi:hypothetical protein